jgi:hypothetical protein
MKFYNLYKLNVKVGDTVYDTCYQTYEQVIFVNHRDIKTDAVYSYHSNGLLVGHAMTTSVHSLICNDIIRIIKL